MPLEKICNSVKSSHNGEESVVFSLLKNCSLGPHCTSFFLVLCCHCNLFPIRNTQLHVGRALTQILLLNIDYLNISLNTSKRYVTRNPLHLALFRFKITTTTNPVLLLMIFNKEEKKIQIFFLMKSEDVEGFMPYLVY